MQKRKQTRRYSDDYVRVLKRNQEKSALQQMMISFGDEKDTDSSDNEYDEKKQIEQIHITAEEMRLDESIRNRGPTISETVITAVNIEQEWDDFDEVMCTSCCVRRIVLYFQICVDYEFDRL